MEFALTRKQLNKKREAEAAVAAGGSTGLGPDPDPASPLWSGEAPVPSPLASAQGRAWTTRGQDGDGGSFFSAGTSFSPGMAESANPGTEGRLPPPPIPVPPPPVRTVGLDQLLDDLQGRAVPRGADGRTGPVGDAHGNAALPGYGGSTLASPAVGATPDPAVAFGVPTSGPGDEWAEPIGTSGVDPQATSRSQTGRHHRAHGRPEASGSQVDVLVRRYIGVVLFVAAAVLLIMFMPSERHAAPSPSGMGAIASHAGAHPGARAAASAPASIVVPVSGVTWFLPEPRATWTSATAGSSTDA